MMRIYYVIPPRAYKSQADAQAAFEAGEVWQCTGHALVDRETSKLIKTTRYRQRQPARYTQGEPVRLANDEVRYVPKTWALQWKPGRVSILRYHVSRGERKVSPTWGKGRGVDLLDERTTTSGEVHRRVKARQADARELLDDWQHHGAWKTSGGPAFGYLKQGGENPSQLGYDFKELTWAPSGLTGPVQLDPDPTCKRAGDRELERYFWSAQVRLYNLSAVRVPMAAMDGGYRTLPAGDVDNIRYGDRWGARGVWNGCEYPDGFQIGPGVDRSSK